MSLLKSMKKNLIDFQKDTVQAMSMNYFFPHKVMTLFVRAVNSVIRVPKKEE